MVDWNIAIKLKVWKSMEHCQEHCFEGAWKWFVVKSGATAQAFATGKAFTFRAAFHRLLKFDRRKSRLLSAHNRHFNHAAATGNTLEMIDVRMVMSPLRGVIFLYRLPIDPNVPLVPSSLVCFAKMILHSVIAHRIIRLLKIHTKGLICPFVFLAIVMQ